MDDPHKRPLAPVAPLSEVRAQTSSDTARVLRLPDGYRVVRILTPKALGDEGAMMRSCFGNQSYCARLETGAADFYSLRDHRNRAHVTMSVCEGELTACLGKANSWPAERYIGHVRAFIEHLGFSLAFHVYELGLVWLDGECLDGASLPDDLRVTGPDWQLLLSGSRITRLPEGMAVEGELALYRTNVATLPDTLKASRLTLLDNGDMPATPGIEKVRKFNSALRMDALLDPGRAIVESLILGGERPPLAWRRSVAILSFNKTSLTDLAPLADLTALQWLDLSDTKVHDLTPLATLSALQTLDLTRAPVRDVGVLAGLTALRTLELGGTQVSDLTPLNGLARLESLILSCTEARDLAPLASLASLETLRLDHTPVDDLKPLAGLPALQLLSAWGTRVADISPLAKITSLRFAFLDDTPAQDCGQIWLPACVLEPASDKTRVLLVEDDEATARAIELMLKSEDIAVYATDLGEEAIDLGKLHAYDVILLDICLPDMSGYQVLRALRRANVKTPVLIVSGCAGTDDKVLGLGYGADDYLIKPFHKDELVARIRAAVRRSTGNFAHVVTGTLTVNLNEKTAMVKGQRLDLTSQEYSALELLSLRKGTSLTREAACDHVYGAKPEPDTGDMDLLMAALRQKLAQASDGRVYVGCSLRGGYLLRDNVYRH